MELSTTEKQRYTRQIVLSDIGSQSQIKLKNSTIYVVGAGGLGSSLLLYLAAAGIGKLVIIDGDDVQLNNLQRQIIYTQNDIGLNKAESAKTKLLALNENIEVTAISQFVTEVNIHLLLNKNSIIADCSDNFKTRYLINDYAIANNCTLVSAAVFKHQIQFGVFNFPYQNKLRSATFSCAFPKQSTTDLEDTCATTGVIGVVPGIAGMLMTNEIIKVVTDSDDVQYNKLLILDMHTLQLKHWNIKRKVGI